MKRKIFGFAFVICAIVAGFILFKPAAKANSVILYKNPGCECCDAYGDYLRHHGFSVSVRPTERLAEEGEAAGIPEHLQGCHLALVGDYAVSGHVPISNVNRLLTERPDIKGLTLPGMPAGSPGMSGRKSGPFNVYAVGEGAPELYAIE